MVPKPHRKMGVKQHLHCVSLSELGYQRLIPNPSPRSHGLKAGNSLVTPLVLQVSMGGSNHLPKIFVKTVVSGDICLPFWELCATDMM